MKRHQFEHRVLPAKAYQNEATVIDDMIRTCPRWLRSVYSGLNYKRTKIMYEHFALSAFYYVDGDDVIGILRIELPEPVEASECRYIYLVQSASTGRLMYFTSELTADGDFFLCAWTREHSHLNFGSVPDETKAVRELYEQFSDYEPAE